MGSELPTKVGEQVEGVDNIEALLIFSVAAFDLAIVPEGKGTNELVANTQAGKVAFEQQKAEYDSRFKKAEVRLTKLKAERVEHLARSRMIESFIDSTNTSVTGQKSSIRLRKIPGK